MIEIFTRAKFSPALVGKLLSMNFLSCVNDYIEGMVTFTALVKVYSAIDYRTTYIYRIGNGFTCTIVLHSNAPETLLEYLVFAKI